MQKHHSHYHSVAGVLAQHSILRNHQQEDLLLVPLPHIRPFHETNCHISQHVL